MMTRHCIAYGCVNSSNKPGCAGLSWHSLPIKNKTLLRTWLIKIKRENTPVTKNSYLCSAHFSAECFQKAIGGSRVYLKPGSIPTVFSFNKERPSRKAPLDRSQSGKSTHKETCSSLADLKLNGAENTIIFKVILIHYHVKKPTNTILPNKYLTNHSQWNQNLLASVRNTLHRFHSSKRGSKQWRTD